MKLDAISEETLREFGSAFGRLIAECLSARQATDNRRARVFTSRDLPEGMSKRAFNERCRRLHRAGDSRVTKHGQVWVAARSAIEEVPRRRAPIDTTAKVHEGPAKIYGGPWTPRNALARAGVRPQRQQIERMPPRRSKRPGA